MSARFQASGTSTTGTPAPLINSIASCGPLEASITSRSGVRASTLSALISCPLVTIGASTISGEILVSSRPTICLAPPKATITSPDPFASDTILCAEDTGHGTENGAGAATSSWEIEIGLTISSTLSSLATELSTTDEHPLSTIAAIPATTNPNFFISTLLRQERLRSRHVVGNGRQCVRRAPFFLPNVY